MLLFFSVGVQGRHFSQTEPASCQVFLPICDWPIMASDGQPCLLRFNLWMLYVDYGFTLVALGRFEEASPLANLFGV